jgi:hypothetical protein
MPVHSANCVKTYAVACRRVLSSVPMELIVSSLVLAFWNKIYELNFKKISDYKYDNYTKNLVGRSFGTCLRNRLLLSGCAMRFTTRSLGCALNVIGYRRLDI